MLTILENPKKKFIKENLTKMETWQLDSTEALCAEELPEKSLVFEAICACN